MTDSPLGDPRLRLTPDGHVYARGRVPGHPLRCRGEAYLAVDCFEDRCATNVRGTVHQENGPGYDSVRGAGHAACSCGALSPHETTGADRKRWHRQHKARVLLGQPEPAGQPAPIAPETIA